jgi:Astacin (Peptidase family M12A)
MIFYFAQLSLSLASWSSSGCFQLEADTGLATTQGSSDSRELTCVTWRDFNRKCKGGLPFYRFSAVAGCPDCLDLNYCKLQCVSKGLDVAGMVRDPRSGAALECRCGASLENVAVWATLTDSEHSLQAAWYLYPPSESQRIPARVNCQLEIWVFRGQLELPPAESAYIKSIVAGSAFASSWEKSVQLRAARWRREESRGGAKRMQLFETALQAGPQTLPDFNAAGIAYSTLSATGQICAGVAESPGCWDAAVADVPACGKYCSPIRWQMGGFASAWTATNSGAKRACPITAGVCRLYNRPVSLANSVPRWPSRTIPVLVDARLGPSVRATVQAAIQFWNGPTCVNFQVVNSAPKSGPYAEVIVAEQGGYRVGCSSPLGPPVGGSRVAQINVASCSDSESVGMLAHEMGHLLGLASTLQRPDRDAFVKIRWENIDPYFYSDFQVDPYQFIGADGLWLPYDFDSIMHPSLTARMIPEIYNPVSNYGTFEIINKQSVSAVNGLNIGQRARLSAGDIQAIKSLYGCASNVADNAKTSNSGSSTESKAREVTSSGSIPSANTANSNASPTTSSRNQTVGYASKDDPKAGIKSQAKYIADAVISIVKYEQANGAGITKDQAAKLVGIVRSTVDVVKQCSR